MSSRRLAPARFGAFEFDLVSGELRKHGLKARLAPKPTVLLASLLEPPLRTRTREELQRQLWPDQAFLDFKHGLNKVVHSLRKALGDTAHHSRFIETVATNGYRFVPEWLQPAAEMERLSMSNKDRLVAVLPIHTRRAGPHLRFLSFQLTSELIDRLSSIPGVRILAESTVRSRPLAGDAAPGVSESLVTRTVLSGYIIQFETTLLFRMELIDGADGSQIFGSHLERTLPLGPHEATGMVEEIVQQILRFLCPPELEVGLPSTLAGFGAEGPGGLTGKQQRTPAERLET